MSSSRRARQARLFLLGALVAAGSCHDAPTAPRVPDTPARLELVDGDGQSGVAGRELTLPLAARVTDARGRVLPGRSVEFVVVSGGGAVAPPSAATNDSGVARTRWTLGTSTALEQRVEARVQGAAGPLTAPARATVMPDTPDSLTSAAAVPDTADAGEALVAPLAVKVADRHGNPVPLVRVAWTVTEGDGTVALPDSATGADGIARARFTLGSSMGNNTVVASLAGGRSVSFHIIGRPGTPATVSRVSGDGQTASAGTALPAPFVLRITDKHGNPAPGVVVTWSVTSGGGSLGAVAATTDAQGVASATLTLGTTAGPNEVTAGVSGLPPVTFGATAFAGPPNTIGVTGDAAAAEVGTRVLLHATVTDRYGNPVSGASVAWAITAGNGSVAPASGVTDSAGGVNGALTLGTRAGPNDVMVTVAGVPPATFTKLGTPLAPSQLALLRGDGQTAPGGQMLPETLAVVARDRYDNPLPDVPVRWVAGTHSGGVAPLSETTDAAGSARAVWTLGSGALDQSATATSGDLPPVRFTARASSVPHPVLRLTSGDGQQGTVGRELPASLVVALTDSTDAPLAGMPVTWTVLEGGGTLDSATSITDVQGQASARWTMGTGVAPGRVSAAAMGATSVTFSATAMPLPPGAIRIASGDAQTDTVGKTLAAPLTVLVVDGDGAPLAGAEVRWSVAAGGGSLSASASTTDADGRAAVQLTLGTSAGPNVVRAAAGDGLTAELSATAVAAPMCSMTWRVDPTTAPILTPVVVTSDARDRFGNAVDTASWMPVLPGAWAGTMVRLTKNTYQWTLGSQAGTLIAWVTRFDCDTTVAPWGAANPFFNSSVSAIATAPPSPPTRIYLVPPYTPYGPPVAGSMVDVEARVVSGTVGVGGVSLSWTVIRGGGSVLVGYNLYDFITDPAGYAVIKWKLGTVVDTNTLVGCGGGDCDTVSVVTKPGAPTRIIRVSGDDQSGPAGETLPLPIVAAVADSFGNRIEGITIQWGAAGDHASATPPTSVAGPNGAETRWRLGSRPEVQNLFAMIVGGSGGGAFTARATPPTVTSLAAASGDGASGTAGQRLDVPLVARVGIGEGIPAPVYPVSWTVAEGGGSLSAPTSLTDDDGLARVQFTLGVVPGVNRVVASAGGRSVTFTITGVAPNSAQTVPWRGDNQLAITATAAAESLIARVVDASGNPLAGRAVTWTVTAGGGSIRPATSTTDIDGRASAQWVVGDTGTNHATAASPGTTPAVFTATSLAAGPFTITRVSGSWQSDTVTHALADPLVVRVADRLGAPLPGVAVSWSIAPSYDSLYNASLSATSTLTDVNGEASVRLTLGRRAKIYAVYARVANLYPGYFEDTAKAGPATKLAWYPGGLYSGIFGQPLSDSIRVKVNDAYGNPVAGTMVSWAALPGDGMVSPTSSLTASTGFAATSWTLGRPCGDPYVCTMTATSGTAPPLTIRISAGYY